MKTLIWITAVMLVMSSWVGAETVMMGTNVPDVAVVPANGMLLGVESPDVENISWNTTEYQVQAGLNTGGVTCDLGVDFVNSEEIFNAKLQLDETGAIGLANLANDRVGTPYLVLKPYSSPKFSFVVGGIYDNEWDLMGAAQFFIVPTIGVVVESVDGQESACVKLTDSDFSLLAGRGLEAGDDWFAKINLLY